MMSGWIQKRLRQLFGLSLFLVAGVMVLGPLFFLIAQGAGEGMRGLWVRVMEVSLPSILLQVFFLALSTTVLALLFAVPLAWLVVRSDLPAKALFRWLAPLPLAIPPYIGAMVYQILLSPGGLVDTLVAGLLGRGASEVHLANIYTLLGAAWVLSLFTYPYIYLLVSASLERVNPSLEEAARSTGMKPWNVFCSVTIPLLRPALLAGGLMVFLYGWADFGVVSLLRVRTVTTVIYYFIRGTMDWMAPSAFSTILCAVTIAVLLVEMRMLRHGAYTQITGSAKPPREIKLAHWRWLASVYASTVLFFSLLLPLAVLGYQAGRLSAGEIASFLMRERAPFLNSLGTAMMGATLALVLALTVAWLQERKSKGIGVSLLFQVGTAIPGTVLGLGMAGFFFQVLPWIYGTPLILVVAYVVLHITPAIQSVKSALAQLPVSIEEAARGLGRGPLSTLREVSLPLITPGLLGGWVLVFILSMRELAATLIVRPPGFDTLPIRVWILTMDVGPEPRAALLALALVATIALPWLLLLIRRPKGFSFAW
jgi:iron(III) transport system permease protein